MSCSNELVTSLMGWLSTVAFKLGKGGYVERQDLIQEGALAVLKAGVKDEALAKTVAIRAMTKYRDRHGICRSKLVNGQKHFLIGRAEYDDLEKVSYEKSPDAVFWENIESDSELSPTDCDALKKWVNSTEPFGEHCRSIGVSERSERDRIKRAAGRVRERWEERERASA